MKDKALRDLAARVGIQVEWRDFRGRSRTVAPPTIAAVLAAMGVPVGSDGDVADAEARLRSEGGAPPLVTARAGMAVRLPGFLRPGMRARLTAEDGTRRDLRIGDARGAGMLPAVPAAGYHRLLTDAGETTIAVAPARCFQLRDLAPRRRLWGLAAQIYAIRRTGDGGIGDNGGVARLAEAAARHGADALALSPDHALFAADPRRYSPYAPSSRLFRNVLLGDPASVPAARRHVAGPTTEQRLLEAMPLIDWPVAARAKLRHLRTVFDATIGTDGRPPADFVRFRRAGGAMLEDHARFEAIHAAQLARGGEWSWRRWPAELRDPASSAVADFAREHAREVTFHVFLQWIADRSRAAAQERARAAGMRIGLLADLAIGMDGDGSHAWARPRDVLTGLAIGAPPDLINGEGQNWGLTTFSPRALTEGGFAPFLATLRAAMGGSGGLRIDHVMGLARLWVVPDGASATEGAYLAFPLTDMLRLVALESVRHGAIVVGEDLGTVPEGFREGMAEAGIHGMRVLWFERTGARFTPPEEWDRDAVAMTTTHDLPTAAGWWAGEDIAWRARISGGAAADEMAARAADKRRLWSSFVAAGLANGRPPEDPSAAVDGAMRYVARAPARLALFPVEDALGLAEQPNLPGTIDEHPNWRRRLPGTADTILDDPVAATRLRTVARERKRR